jgi:serine/threonine-protein kinase RsbW
MTGCAIQLQAACTGAAPARGPASRPRRTTLELPAAPAAVPEARRHARAAVRAWGWADDLAADCETVVSELVTNAVRAARAAVGPGRVRLRVTDCRTGMAVQVWDPGDEMPCPAPPGRPDDALGGRGLLIVAALAARHGTRPTPGGGKHAWALITPGAP